MADLTGIVESVGAVLISSGITAFIYRSGQRALRRANDAQGRAAIIQGQNQAQGQVISGEAKFREDQSIRITNLERRLDEMSVRLDESNRLREQQGIDAARVREVDRMRYEDLLAKERERFEAREDQLVRWGSRDPSPPPREAPPFVWPPLRP